MKYPNFFIVGGPKCGTTALSEYLRDHRNILLSWPKEPHFFAEDLGSFRRIQTLEDYLDLFPVKPELHLAAGEASVFYLCSTVALQNIQKFNPASKIIVMVRNPVDVAYSLHSHHVFTYYEDETDFETAWRLQESRSEGKNLPQACLVPELLQYRDVAKFGQQLERVFRLFDREQVLVLMTEDLASSTRDVYEKVLAFLGVPSDGRASFPRVNVNTVHRYPRFGKFLYTPPALVRSLEAKIKKALSSVGIREFRGWHRLLAITARPARRQPLSAELRSELQSCFREDVYRLGDLLGRDLSSWVDASPDSA